jgi:two-component system, chemotaxis family, chemotaxis protein CheY
VGRGRGTHLPIRMPAQPPSGRPKKTREFEVADSNEQKPVVLLLDDDAEICEAIESVLTDVGLEVICLPNGEEGFQHLQAHPTPALILLDLMMPVMDGWRFVDRIRTVQHLKDIPIVVITAAGPHWGYPAEPVLRKPVSRDELIATVLGTMDHRGLRAAPATADGWRSAGAEPDPEADDLESTRSELRAALQRPQLDAKAVVALRAALRLLDAVVEHEDRALKQDALRVALEALKRTRIAM